MERNLTVVHHAILPHLLLLNNIPYILKVIQHTIRDIERNNKARCFLDMLFTFIRVVL